MDHAADEIITNLIEELADECTRGFKSAEERQSYINQIAQLRASMNPTIIQQKD